MSEGKPVILYVDDDPDYCEALRVILEANGYEMAEAASAEEGLEVYKARKPDLVIVDLMMEEVDSGTALVKELRLLGNKAPIFMLSSVGEGMNLSADYAAMGLAGVFQKPIDRATLLTVLKTKLGR
ncbi:MAG: response regulator [Acidobacteria bacterium]|nr:response regulator [Acidobacteriota bacterium]MCK6684436.1 response regulator [Thermoanaerobaculia bacterium]